MILDEKALHTTIAYRCPCCTEVVMGAPSIFALNGDLIRLKCDCGESDLTVEPSGKTTRFTVPCLLCGKPHRYQLDKEIYLSRELHPLACPYTGYEIAYIGEQTQVQEAIAEEANRLQQILNDADVTLGDLRSDGGREQIEDPDNVGDVVRFLLCELDADGKISCYCKEQGEIPLYNFQVLSERVRVYCECCNAEAVFPLRGVTDAQKFLELDEMELK